MSKLIDLFFLQTPLWLFIPITVGLVVLAAGGGRWLGSKVRGREADETERPTGTMVGANFALLAFILAFTFNMTADRFEARKALLLDEVNSIGTTFLRTDFLPEPERGEARVLLREYVDLRVENVVHMDQLSAMITRSEAIQNQLWSQVAALGASGHNPILLRMYIESLNVLIDFHAKRVTLGTKYRIPGIIWLTLYFMTIVSTAAIGYQFGLAEGRSRAMFIVLTLSFSAVILLIADLDRAGEGLLRLDQSPMTELRATINNSPD